MRRPRSVTLDEFLRLARGRGFRVVSVKAPPPSLVVEVKGLGSVEVKLGRR